MSQDQAADQTIPEPEPGAPGLRWGIKLTFLQYIFNMPDGRCSVTDGAASTDEQLFYFSPDEGSVFDAAGAGLLKFRGDVRFAGHGGFLFVRVADPWLRVEDGAATLSIAALPGETPDRIPLATLDLTTARVPDGPDRLIGSSVQLTEEGSELFNLVYPVGEPFDDLTIIHRAAPAAERMP
jgi:hypothetical protein